MLLTMKVVRKELPNRSEQQRKEISTICKYILFLTVTFLPVIWVGCKKNTPEVEVNDIVLDKTYLSLAKEMNAIITAKISPYAAADTPVDWESSNPTVATVTNGKVEAKAYGTVVITAKAGNQTTTCSVTVKPAIIGVYYFDGWSGTNRHALNPNEPWAANAPTHLSKRFVQEFPEREPIWGWRNDSQDIMERQIDLAAGNGVDFFLYCWYWKNDRGALNEAAIKSDSKHTSLDLYLKAKNKKKIQYSLLIANHSGAEILGGDNWDAAVKYWAQYFRDPQYLTVDGKPLVVIFGTSDEAINDSEIARMQESAVKAGFKDGLAIAGCGGNAKRKAFTHTTHYNVIPGYSAGSEEHNFQELIDATKSQWIGREDQPYIPLLTSGWDKRPWEGPDGLDQVEGWYFTGDTPYSFKSFLNDAITWMDYNPTKTTKERLTLIYAWNELGEGGYLVPTKGDPEAAKLKKIGELLKERSK